MWFELTYIIDLVREHPVHATMLALLLAAPSALKDALELLYGVVSACSSLYSWGFKKTAYC